MTNRELLEMAAKACGYDTSHPWNAERLLLDPPVDALCIDGVSTGWNPLTYDGHALRLAVKLRMDLMLYSDTKGAFIGSRGRSEKQFAEVVTDDPYAATRRAIVRAAAEIGKAMP